MIYVSIGLVLFVFLFFFVLYHSCRQNKLIIKKDNQLNDLCNQLDVQNKKYRTLYQNVEKKYGYCEARQAARKPGGEYAAQMFSIESTTTAPEGHKSIKVF